MTVDPIIFIPAAGRGSRVKSGRGRLPKPLISIGNIPLIAHIMNYYPHGSRFHIAVGYKGDLIRQVVELFSELRGDEVTFSETQSWKSESKGLSHTLLDSEDFLQEPFIFHAVDSLLVQSHIDKFNEVEGNYAIHCKPIDEGTYRVLTTDGWSKESLSPDSSPAYIGVSKISDYRDFWKLVRASADSHPEDGETIGLRPSDTSIINLQPNSWLDTGHEMGLARARTFFPNKDIVLERHNEAIWSFGNRMYKFHEDSSFIENRVARGLVLTPFVPRPTLISENIYAYDRAPGVTLSRTPIESFGIFLAWIENFWDVPIAKEVEDSRHSEYIAFYKSKTYDRVEAYLAQQENPYIVTKINNENVRSINDLLAQVDWNTIASPTIVRAHGDLHPENVVYDSISHSFHLLDWRQDIAGFTDEFGDLYYDLGKILHGLLVDHQLIQDKRFSSFREKSTASWQLSRSQTKESWEIELRMFVDSKGFDWSRVRLLSALIFLNIAVLHESTYSDFLFIYGHDALEAALSDRQMF